MPLFARVKDGITDFINKLQADASSEASCVTAVKKFDASTDKGPFSGVKELITDLSNRLQPEASPEANHKPDRGK